MTDPKTPKTSPSGAKGPPSVPKTSKITYKINNCSDSLGRQLTGDLLELAQSDYMLGWPGEMQFLHFLTTK
jgi:hypothetical protein